MSDSSSATDAASTVTDSASASASSSAAESSSLASAISSSIASQVSSSIISEPDSTTTVAAATTAVYTSTVSAASQAPTTNIITSVVTQSATSNGQTNTEPVTVVVTSVNTPQTTNVQTVIQSSTASSASTTSSAPAAISNSPGSGGSDGKSSGLSTAGKTAIAVVIPVAFVALLVAFGIWFWRKRKQRKDDREQRRKEIDEYGYNPNNDPTLPAVGSEAAGAPQMAEDSNAGYRGWGAATGSNRKASTTLSGGHTQGQLSESGNSYGGPGSPGETGAYSDGHSGDPLVNQRDTMGSDELGALGAAPAAGNNQGIRRGPSNASSAYSAGGRSEASDEPAVPPLPSNQYDLNPTNSYGYTQHGPYGDGSYGGGVDSTGMPVVRDVQARRNTRIQQGGSYQQGNSGIAQNF